MTLKQQLNRLAESENWVALRESFDEDRLTSVKVNPLHHLLKPYFKAAVHLKDISLARRITRMFDETFIDDKTLECRTICSRHSLKASV